MNKNLPFSEAVNIEALQVSLKYTTTSYKYFFLLSLTDLVQWSDFTPGVQVPLDSIAVEMLLLAWYPHTRLGLTLGKQDKLGTTLDEVSRVANTDDSAAIAAYMRRKARVDYPLQRYVPYRLLRGFFENELYGLPDGVINGRVEELAQSQFETKKPLYRFCGGDSIVMHPDWLAYMKEHNREVRAWVYAKLVRYLQIRNPGVLDLDSALLPCLTRDGQHASSQQYQQFKVNVLYMPKRRTLGQTSYIDSDLAQVVSDLWSSISVPADESGRQ